MNSVKLDAAVGQLTIASRMNYQLPLENFLVSDLFASNNFISLGLVFMGGCFTGDQPEVELDICGPRLSAEERLDVNGNGSFLGFQIFIAFLRAEG